jgi:hypothetical protein
VLKDRHIPASGPAPVPCPSAWAVIVLYSGLAVFCALLAISFALGTGNAALTGLLTAASALFAVGAGGTYLRLTGRLGRQST